MIEFILSKLGSWFAPLLAAAGGLLVILFRRWRMKRKDELIDRQQEVIQAHEKIQEVHKQDNKLESEADKQIDDIREKVDEAKTPEEGAEIVAEELNKYFEGRK